MSSWIGTFDQEEKLKRKRVTKLSVVHNAFGSPRMPWKVRNRSFRNRKRFRELAEKNQDNKVVDAEAADVKVETEIIQIEDVKDDKSTRSNNQEDNEEKILIDTQTLDMIKIDVQSILPTSLYNMATSLAESEAVLYLHSQQNCFRNKRLEQNLYFSKDRMYPTENTTPKSRKNYGRRQNKISNRSKGKRQSIGLLTSVFNNLGMIQEDEYDYNDDQESESDSLSSKSELRDVFVKLSKRVGSLEEQVKTWEEAKIVLETYLFFPRQVRMRKKRAKPEKRFKRNITNSVKQYLSSITRGAFKQGLLKTGETWKQIKVTDTNATPLADELAMIQLRLDMAKLNRKDERVLNQVELMMEEKEKRKEVELKKAAKEAAKNILRPLTPSEQEIVQECMYGIGPPGEIIAMSGTDSVQRDSIQKLQPGRWLNDEVIHYFLVMLAKRDEDLVATGARERRSHFFKSFFITKLLDESGYSYRSVKRWSKKVAGKDIFNLDKVIVPVNISGMHWCLVVISVQEKKIQFYDSMGGGGKRYLDGLMQYLKDEHMDKKKTPMDGVDDWKLVVCEPDTPQQENGFDCGVFTCMFADFISQDMPLSISQEHISECRDRIALSIMKGKAIG